MNCARQIRTRTTQGLVACLVTGRSLSHLDSSVRLSLAKTGPRSPVCNTCLRRPCSRRGGGEVPGSAQTLVIHAVRAEVADRLDPPCPDPEHEEPFLRAVTCAQVQVQRKAATRVRAPALEPGRSGGAHADEGAVLGPEPARLRPVVRELAGLVVDRIRRLALPAAAVDQRAAADSGPELSFDFVRCPGELAD